MRRTPPRESGVQIWRRSGRPTASKHLVHAGKSMVTLVMQMVLVNEWLSHFSEKLFPMGLMNKTIIPHLPIHHLCWRSHPSVLCLFASSHSSGRQTYGRLGRRGRRREGGRRSQFARSPLRAFNEDGMQKNERPNANANDACVDCACAPACLTHRIGRRTALALGAIDYNVTVFEKVCTY